LCVLTWGKYYIYYIEHAGGLLHNKKLNLYQYNWLRIVWTVSPWYYYTLLYKQHTCMNCLTKHMNYVTPHTTPILAWFPLLSPAITGPDRIGKYRTNYWNTTSESSVLFETIGAKRTIKPHELHIQPHTTYSFIMPRKFQTRRNNKEFVFRLEGFVCLYLTLGIVASFCIVVVVGLLVNTMASIKHLTSCRIYILHI